MTGRRFLDLAASFGQVVLNTIVETSIPEWMEASASYLPQHMAGISNQKSCRVYELTDEVADVIAAAAEKMPKDPATLMGIHTLRHAEEPIQDSVFRVRRPHFMIEMLPTASEPDPKKVEEGKKWSMDFMDALMQIDPRNLEKAQCFTHTSPEDANFQEMYGEQWETMVAAKKKYDPKNIFRSGPSFKGTDLQIRTSWWPF